MSIVTRKKPAVGQPLRLWIDDVRIIVVPDYLTKWMAFPTHPEKPFKISGTSWATAHDDDGPVVYLSPRACEETMGGLLDSPFFRRSLRPLIVRVEGARRIFDLRRYKTNEAAGRVFLRRLAGIARATNKRLEKAA